MPAAFAQDRSLSYSTWIVAADSVTLRYLLPAGEAQRLIGREVPVLTTRKIGSYLLTHVSVEAAGRTCAPIDQGYDLGLVDPLAVGPGWYGFEIVFLCDRSKGLTLTNRAIFEQSSEHINFARIESNGRRVEALFTRDRQHLQLPVNGDPPSAGLASYARLGISHILASPDRLCLLLALLLLWRSPRDAWQNLAALAGGYVLAVIVTVSTAMVPQTDLLEASFGFLIALIALAAVVPRIVGPSWWLAGWPALLLVLALAAALRHSPHAAWLLAGAAAFTAGLFALSTSGARPHPGGIVAALFGFLDGFVLPAMQTRLQLPPRVQLPMLLGFDLGAVLASAVLMGGVAAAYLALRSRALVPSRPLLNEPVAACLGGIGSFWLVTRLPIWGT